MGGETENAEGPTKAQNAPDLLDRLDEKPLVPGEGGWNRSAETQDPNDQLLAPKVGGVGCLGTSASGEAPDQLQLFVKAKR